VEPEHEAGHHPEVAAAAADGPKQVRVFLGAGCQLPAVAGDDFSLEQVVAGQAEAAGQVADPAAQGQPADAGGGNDTGRGGQAEGVGGAIEVAQGGAAVNPCDPTVGIDAHAAHHRKVEDHAAIVGAEAGDVVTAAADRQPQSLP
jgi:hypothetical protein